MIGDGVLDTRETFAALVCGGITILLVFVIPYVFGWYRRK